MPYANKRTKDISTVEKNKQTKKYRKKKRREKRTALMGSETEY